VEEKLASSVIEGQEAELEAVEADEIGDTAHAAWAREQARRAHDNATMFSVILKPSGSAVICRRRPGSRPAPGSSDPARGRGARRSRLAARPTTRTNPSRPRRAALSSIL
jgi:hypothetical protein